MFCTTTSLPWLFAITILQISRSRASILTQPGCRTAKLDVAFLIDGSVDVDEAAFDEYKDYVRSVVDVFDVSEYSTRVSLTSYGESPNTLTYLEEIYSDRSAPTSSLHKQNLLDGFLANMTAPGGKRRLGKAIHHVCDKVLGMASDVEYYENPKVLVVFSGGFSEDDISSRISCKNNVHGRKDVYIIGVSTGRRGKSSLNTGHVDVQISAPRGFMFMFDGPLVQEICNAAFKSCPGANTELTFLYQANPEDSESDFGTLKEWMADVAWKFDTTRQTGVNIVQIGNEQTVDSVLMKEVDGFKEEVMSIQKMNGHGRVFSALKYIQNFYVDNPVEGDKTRTLVLILDEIAGDLTRIEEIARDLKRGGVQIYAVITGQMENAFKEELEMFTSHPLSHYVLYKNDYDHLLRSPANTLLTRICQHSYKLLPSLLLDMQFMVEYSSSGTSASDLGLSANKPVWSYTMFGSEAELQAWIKQLIDMYYYGPYYTQVGLITYGSSADVAFDFNAFADKESIFSAIESSSMSSNYETSDYEVAFQAADQMDISFGREDANKAMILVTHSAPDQAFMQRLNELWARGYAVLWINGGSWRWNAAFKNQYQNEYFKLMQQRMYWDWDINMDAWGGAAGGGGRGVLATEEIASGIGQQATKSKECTDGELDLVFLLDGSSSIKPPENFTLVKDWANSIISYFDVNPQITRVGVNQFGTASRTEFFLNNYEGKPDVQTAVDNVKQIKGATYTSSAINFTLDHSFLPQNGARDNVQRVLIIMSDGKTTDREINDVPFSIQRMKGTKNLEVFTVGVGNAVGPELEVMASKPNNYLTSDRFDELNLLQSKLRDKICETIPPGASAYLKIDDLSSLKQFLKAISSKFTLDEKRARITISTYSRSGIQSIIVPTFASRNLQTFENAIDALEFTDFQPLSYTCNLDLAFNQLLANNSVGSSSNDVILTITDTPTTSSPQQAAARLLLEDVKMFGVGIGMQSSKSGIPQIANANGDNVFYIPRYSSLRGLKSTMSRKLCEACRTACFSKAFDIVLANGINTSVLSSSDNASVTELLDGIVAAFDVGPGFTTFTHVPKQSSAQTINPAVVLNEGLDALEDLRTVARKNVPKFIILIYEIGNVDNIELKQEILRANIEGVTVLTILVDGTTTSQQLTETFVTSPTFNDLPDFLATIVDGICLGGNCPLYPDKHHKGLNLLEFFGLTTQRGKPFVKRRIGLSENSVAFRLHPKSKLTGSFDVLYPNGLPNNLAVVADFRLLKKGQNKEWYLLYISKNDNLLAIKIDGANEEITLMIGEKPHTEIDFYGAKVSTIFDRRWHKVEMYISTTTVSLYIDCEEVATQALDYSLKDLKLNSAFVVVGKLVGKISSVPMDIQQLDIICEKQRILQDCCGRPSYKGDECQDTVTVKPKPPIEKCNCPPGAPGAIGPPGLIGPPGIPGIDGLDGFPGPKGDKGDNVQQGSKGPGAIIQVGPPGPQGLAGPPGQQGSRGPPGLPGTGGANVKANTGMNRDLVRGLVNEMFTELLAAQLPRMIVEILEDDRYSMLKKGDRGFPGKTGMRGYDGAKGSSGVPGPRGPPGLIGGFGQRGMRGLRGEKGDRGEKGEEGRGVRGYRGSPGLRGLPGETIHGHPGSVGPRGPMGRIGARGSPGTPGLQGPPGTCDATFCYNTVYDLFTQQNSNFKAGNQQYVKG